MNEIERQKLNRFLQELVQAHVANKDVEAERMIRENCNYQPDASYLLVQRALVLEDALKNAQDESAQLRAEVAALRGTSARFLNDSAWGNRHQAGVSGSDMKAVAATAPAAEGSERGSPFAGTMATTAAGVVAGSLLFHGIEQMMGAKDSGFVGKRTSAADSGDDSASAANDASGDDLAALIPSAADLDSI